MIKLSKQIKNVLTYCRKELTEHSDTRPISVTKLFPPFRIKPLKTIYWMEFDKAIKQILNNKEKFVIDKNIRLKF